MRLLQVCKYYHPKVTGVTMHVDNLSRQLAGMGHDVTVLTWGGENSTEERDGVTVKRVRWGDRRGFVNAVRAARPDVVHSHGIWEHTPMAAHGARRAGAPYFVTMHGTWLFLAESEGFESRWRRFKYLTLYRNTLWRWLLNNAAGVIPLNLLEEADVRSLGVAEERIHRIPNATDPQRFSPGEGGAVGEQRQSLGLPQEAPVALFAGGVQRQKGIYTIVRAAARLKDVQPDLHWVVCGDGPHRKDAEALAAQAGLGERIRFMGRVAPDTIPDYFRAADVFVLPSVMEPFATVFLEAMASGLPCIGRDDGGTPEIILEGETGHLLHGDDDARLAEVVAKLAQDRNGAKRMGQAGRKRVQELFAWPKVAADIARRYERVGE